MRPHVLSIGFVSGLLILTACAEQTPPTTDNASQIPVTSGDDVEPGSSVHDLPIPEGVRAARIALAARLNVEPTSILILEAHEKEWSDSCLGLGGPAESCLAVITPGYDVLMTYQGTEYRYRTNVEGTVVRSED